MASDQLLSTGFRRASLVTPSMLLQYWGPVALYAGIIFYGSSLSSPPEVLASFLQKLSDKVLHFCEYSLLGALLFRACRHASAEWVARHWDRWHRRRAAWFGASLSCLPEPSLAQAGGRRRKAGQRPAFW